MAEVREVQTGYTIVVSTFELRLGRHRGVMLLSDLWLRIGQFPVKIRHIVEQRGVQDPRRTQYTPPKLKLFGPVGALTQSDTGAMVESTSMMGTACQDRLDRQMC